MIYSSLLQSRVWRTLHWMILTSTWFIPLCYRAGYGGHHAGWYWHQHDLFFYVTEQGLEDITLDDIDINNLDKELDNDTNSLSSSISAGLSSGRYTDLYLYLDDTNAHSSSISAGLSSGRYTGFYLYLRWTGFYLYIRWTGFYLYLRWTGFYLYLSHGCLCIHVINMQLKPIRCKAYIYSSYRAF